MPLNPTHWSFNWFLILLRIFEYTHDTVCIQHSQQVWFRGLLTWHQPLNLCRLPNQHLVVVVFYCSLKVWITDTVQNKSTCKQRSWVSHTSVVHFWLIVVFKSLFHIPCKHGQQHSEVMLGGGCGLWAQTSSMCFSSHILGETEHRHKDMCWL